MTKNVLILGAGASHHYGFPLARDIVRQVIDKTDMPVPERTRELGLDADVFEAFVRRLRMSGATSVDQFAEYLDDQAEISMAKALIAYYLALHERRDDLTHQGRQDPWYELLANHLIGPTLNTFPQRDIAIITFNYERSLDQYLYDCLLSRFKGKHPVEEIRGAFLRLPLIHIYGRIGHLPGFARAGEAERRYEPIMNHDQLARATGSMHLLPELRRNEGLGDRDAARRCLAEATDDVTFLGFAYSQENLEALDLTKTHKGKRLHGTVLGFELGEPRTELDERLRAFGGAAFTGAWTRTVHAAFQVHPRTILGKAR